MNIQKQINIIFDQKLEKYRSSNGDIPTNLTKEILIDQLKKYLDNKSSLQFIYSLVENLYPEIAYTNPIDQKLFQAIHDIELYKEQKLSESNIKDKIKLIHQNLSINK